MSTIKGGVTAYNDCAEFCENLLAEDFAEFVADPSSGLSQREVDAAKYATQAVLKQLAYGFRKKASNLEQLASPHRGKA